MMLKKQLSWLLSGLLLLCVAAQPAGAGQQGDKQTTPVETIKSEVAKIGVGEKAKATIIKKDGTKVKGYIARADEDDFVIRDRKTDAATTIRYTDVAKVERNRGHSTARNVGLGVAVGAGAVITTLLIIIAHAND
jgi:hypothetical protein